MTAHPTISVAERECLSNVFPAQLTTRMERATCALVTCVCLCVSLQINSLLILPIVREIYMKATSMPLPARYPSGRKTSRPTHESVNKGRKLRSNRFTSSPGKASNGRVNKSLESPSDDGSTGNLGLLAAYKSDTQETRGLTGTCGANTSTTSTLATTSTPTTSTGATASSSLGHSVSKASLLVSLRAATLLLPLYGLHYLVIVYRPDIE